MTWNELRDIIDQMSEKEKMNDIVLINDDGRNINLERIYVDETDTSLFYDTNQHSIHGTNYLYINHGEDFRNLRRFKQLVGYKEKVIKNL